MAARAQAARRASRPAQRRPSARRRPGPRSGGSRIHWDRVGRIALTLVLAAVLYSYLNPAIDLVRTYTATSEAKAELHELLDENKRLHRRIQTSDDPVALDRRARARGLVEEGETPIIVRGLKP